jgi:COP9 signalosome complex subunit 1
MLVKTLEAISHLPQDRFKEAAIRMVNNIGITNEDLLTTIVRPRDLGFYAILCSLHSMSRAEIKTHILNASNFKSLMDSTGDIQGQQFSDVIENFLNGRYMEFQRQIAAIARDMQYDVFFGHRIQKIVKEIRKKALVQYVTPYKVIDLKEIGRAFDMSIERVEQEIAELIIQKHI